MNRLRPLALLSLLAAVALIVAACGSGGSDGEKASSSTDVNDLLTQTFSGAKKVDSGNIDVSVRLDAKGANTGLSGPVTAKLSGPFQVQGDGKLPKFKFDLAFEGAGQSVTAGATSTGKKGYVSFQGTDYVVSDQVFKQFEAGYEETRKKSKSGKQPQSFASLGMDPRKWLTDPKNEGDAKVGDDDAIKITGGVDVAKLLDDVNTAMGKASSLGLQNAQVPQKLTAAQQRQVEEAVKDPKVEIYTGKDDSILRRMVIRFGVDDKPSKTTATVALDIAVTDVNEDQSISEPDNAKPFDQLVGQLGQLGLGSASSGSGSSGSSGSQSGSSNKNLDKYAKCITDAGSDVEKARKCAALLTG
jgi:hypothetical protein